MQSNQIETIKRIPIQEIIGRYLKLKKRGREWEACCPFHPEDTPSFKVNEKKNIFKCFGCGESGDAIDFVAKFTHKSTSDAIKEIQGTEYTGPAFNPPPAPKNPAVMPVPESAPPPDFTHYKYGAPTAVYEWRDAAGRLNGYTCRFEFPDGKKDILPFSFRESGKWMYKSFNKPRPLRGLDGLTARPSAAVMVVEGEKTMDAAAVIFPSMVVVTWPGGTNALHHVDLSPLNGRKVIISPDLDAPGLKAAGYIAKNIQPAALRFLLPDGDYRKGWDLADYSGNDPRGFLKANLRKDLPEKPAATEQPIPPPPPIRTSESSDTDTNYYKILGYNTSERQGLDVYVFSNQARKVLCFSSSGISKSALMTFAPLNYWEMNYPGNRGGVNMDMVQNYLIQQAMRVGIFNPAHTRGRGAWMDGKSVVIHAGSHLIVDGNITNLQDHKSRYVYEAMESLEIPETPRASDKASAAFLSFLKKINWDRPISAYLLAGWIVLAPVCGALRWRPHIWLTGAAGTGKSWILREVIKRMLGRMFIDGQGTSTEAGIRQILQSDALPVTFDEAEANTAADQARVQAILGLMRSASSEDGGFIFKGSGTGKATGYLIRSCFAFASIALQLKNKSDKSRISVLSISRDTSEGAESRWQEIQSSHASLITTQYVESIQTRTIGMLPIILQNADTFSRAAAAVLGEQRAGDQIGTLLAGAYSLVSRKEISYDDALSWVKRHRWTDELQAEGQRDERALLDKIVDTTVRVTTMAGITVERQMATLCLIAMGKVSDHVLPEIADQALRRHGVKVVDGWVVIGAPTSWLSQILRGTSWEVDPITILCRLSGAERMNSTSFAPGIKKNAARIPGSYLDVPSDIVGSDPADEFEMPF